MNARRGSGNRPEGAERGADPDAPALMRTTPPPPRWRAPYLPGCEPEPPGGPETTQPWRCASTRMAGPPQALIRGAAVALTAACSRSRVTPSVPGPGKPRPLQGAAPARGAHTVNCSAAAEAQSFASLKGSPVPIYLKALPPGVSPELRNKKSGLFRLTFLRSRDRWHNTCF